MTIRQRLSLSFLVILGLFALNLVIYFWGNQRRETTVERLRRAISRQALISALNQNLNDIQKQVTLVTQITAAAAADPAETERFGEQLKKIQTEIEELRGLAEPETYPNIDAFNDAYKKLGSSWQVFY